MSEAEPKGTNLSVYAATAAGVAAAVVILWLLAAGLLPLGVPGEWTWELRPLPNALSTTALATAFVLVLAGAFLLDAARRPRLRLIQAAVALAFLVVASYELPLQLLRAEPGGWARATVAVCADLTMGYLTEAVRLDSLRDLREWLRDVQHRTCWGAAPARVVTHPPGPVLAFRAWIALVERNPALQRLAGRMYTPESGTRGQLLATARHVCTTPLAGIHIDAALLSIYLMLLAIPLVVLGTAGLAWAQLGPRVAAVAACLSAAIPSLVAFVPSIDGWSTVVAVWSLACWAWAVRKGSLPGAVLAGAAWGLGLQWTFGLLALALFFAFDMALVRPRRLAALSGALLGGILLAHLPLVALGYNPVTSFLGSTAAHRVLTHTRSYLPWLALNAWDMLVFAGPALVVVAAAASTRRERGTLLPVAVTLGLLLVSGSTRGEVGRIWGFLMPLAAVPAAHLLCRLEDVGFIVGGTLVLAAQVAVTLALPSYLLLVSV